MRAIIRLFTPVNFDGAIFYRKSGSPQRAFRPLPELRAAPPQIIEVLPPPVEKAAPPPLMAIEPAQAQALPEPDIAGRDFLAEANEFFIHGHYNEAASCLEPLSDEDRGEDGLLLLSRAYANMGRLEEASKWCERAQAANSLNKAAHVLLATIRQEQARGEEAVKSLKKALYLDQDFVIAHFMLGKLLVSSGGGAQAQMHIRTAHMLLESKKDDDLLPDSDGMMAGRLKEIIALMLKGPIYG
jgi:chemotaxis protein methyltransferase CheR